MLKELIERPIILDFWNSDPDNPEICLPEGSLYHYTSSVRAIESIIAEGQLWLSKSTVMNDYSEINYGCDLLHGLIEEERVKNAHFDHFLSKFDEAMRDNIFGDLYILSFSMNGDSRLLWDSYSRKSGYNIEFSSNFIKDFKTGATSKVNQTPAEGKKINIGIYSKNDKHAYYSYSAYANKVLYDRNKQILIFKEIIDFAAEAYEIGNYFFAQEALDTAMKFIPFFKDGTLRDEEEYRLIVIIRDPNKTSTNGKKRHLEAIQYYREINNKLFPYIILKMHNRDYIKSVSIGYGNDELAYSTLHDFLSTLRYDITIHQPRYSLRTFRPYQ